METVLVACDDLMARSRIDTTLRHLGLSASALSPAADPAMALATQRPDLIVVDLTIGEARWSALVAAARALEPPVPVLAFGPHVDRDAQSAARAAGCTLVVANSRLARELPSLIERLLAAHNAGRNT